MFKVNNKDTRTMLVSIVNFELVNAGCGWYIQKMFTFNIGIRISFIDFSMDSTLDRVALTL